jgi:hypothetical protein
MIKREFESMSREELRAYILEHREDERAFQLEFRLKNQTVKSSLIIRTHKKKT